MIHFARLGFVAGAFFVAPSLTISAQVVVPPGSEVPIPPKPKTDSAAALPKTDTIKAAFGANYDRLVEVKTKYDPTNFFQVNQNIKPTA